MVRITFEFENKRINTIIHFEFKYISVQLMLTTVCTLFFSISEIKAT